MSLTMRWAVVCLMIGGGVKGQVLGRNYGRSMTITRQGIVATCQALASEEGVRILERGGSAVDAAIAANAVLAVTEPMMDGIGGDLFAMVWEAKTGKLTGLNSSGPAPRGLTPEFLAARGIKEMPVRGIHSVTVPGAVAGWEAMHKRYGKLPWKDLFQGAIAYAEEGFPVAEGMHESWETKYLKENAESARLFLPGGAAPATGQIFRNPELGRALRLIAEKGAESFYKGEIAAAIVKTSRALGGTMTAEDLAGFAPEWVQPVYTDYRGWRVYEMPPNDQGMAALEMLNIMEAFPAAPGGPWGVDELHTRIEAMKLAYSDLFRYNADPQETKVPVKGIISEGYGRERAARIDPKKANCKVTAGTPVDGDTTYLTVVDREGNVTSWIQSVSGTFGSAVTVEGLGILLQNRGGTGFTLENKPNMLAGGKRPRHTIIPAFMEKGDLHIGFGIMGGPNQPLAHAQFVSNIVDYGMNVQAALEAPRFTKPTADGCEVTIESRVPLGTLQGLSERGHNIRIAREYTEQMGRGQAILHDAKTGVNYGASDPRADGAATPEPIR